MSPARRQATKESLYDWDLAAMRKMWVFEQQQKQKKRRLLVQAAISAFPTSGGECSVLTFSRPISKSSFEARLF